MNDIDRSIEFCSYLDPGFSGRIEGASAADILRLEQLTGHPLYAEHREFLERLGADAGGLSLGPVSTRVHALLIVLERTPGTPPPQVELFAVGTGDNDADLFLVPHAGRIGIVEHFSLYGEGWQAFSAAGASPLASTIPEFICSAMMRSVRMSKKPLRQGYMQLENEPGALEKIAHKIEQMGFQRLWFSTGTLCAAQRGTVDILAVQRRNVPLNIEIAGEKEDPLNDIAAELKSTVDLSAWEL